ncbi:hypothetical protein BC831DRAFT_451970 [Entophlyctis helioformis]|nr:hypothetical protein BC831DRAFT_451970 [Entophlyctis helioformis]
MSFRFDFGGSDETDSQADEHAAAPTRPVAPAKLISLSPSDFQGQIVPMLAEALVCSPQVTLYKRSVSDVKFHIAADDDLEVVQPANELVQSIEQQTDLIPGVYEGGLKTWECSIDLVQYLEQAFGARRMDGLRVMELGCGSGLPGLYCLGLGAHVDFQDYNEPVLRMVTIPNVLLNTTSRPDAASVGSDGLFEAEVVLRPEGLARSQFYTGDWTSLQSMLESGAQSGQYDLVVTAETIYSIDTLPSLYAITKSLLKPGGVALVAAKTVYFGCSGSLTDFVRLAERDGASRIATVALNTDTVRREIVQLTF